MSRLESDTLSTRYLDEIRLFIEYGVAETQQQAALASLRFYATNSMALVVLRDFYSRLPKFRDEAVNKIFRIISRRGMLLLQVDTARYQYLYFFDGKQPVYIGEKRDGITDSEILQFFGYRSNEDFLKKLDHALENEAGSVLEQEVFCPACGVAQGDEHELGCPVEICPWCDGQLNYCNCRFEKLGTAEIVAEAEIDRLAILLSDKGRVPFSAEHAPSYPNAGNSEQS